MLGFGDIQTYTSCKIHYKKLDEDNKCPKCNLDLPAENILQDFRSEVYVETTSGDKHDEESQVKEIIFFKKALSNSQDYTEDKVEGKLNEMVWHCPMGRQEDRQLATFL